MLTAMLISMLSAVLAMPAVAQYSVAQQQNGPESIDERELGEHGGNGYGSFYRVKIGDNEITVRCPPTLMLQSCVAAALELMKGMKGVEAIPKP